MLQMYMIFSLWETCRVVGFVWRAFCYAGMVAFSEERVRMHFSYDSSIWKNQNFH